MDALPILENTDLAFQSTHEGVMHACGHDFHMTIALGLLKNVVNAQLNNDVVFFFNQLKKIKVVLKYIQIIIFRCSND